MYEIKETRVVCQKYNNQNANTTINFIQLRKAVRRRFFKIGVKNFANFRKKHRTAETHKKMKLNIRQMSV